MSPVFHFHLDFFEKGENGRLKGENGVSGILRCVQCHFTASLYFGHSVWRCGQSNIICIMAG